MLALTVGLGTVSPRSFLQTELHSAVIAGLIVDGCITLISNGIVLLATAILTVVALASMTPELASTGCPGRRTADSPGSMVSETWCSCAAKVTLHGH